MSERGTVIAVGAVVGIGGGLGVAYILTRPKTSTAPTSGNSTIYVPPATNPSSTPSSGTSSGDQRGSSSGTQGSNSSPSSSPPPSGAPVNGIPTARPQTLPLQANGVPYGWFSQSTAYGTYLFPAIPAPSQIIAANPTLNLTSTWYLGLGLLYQAALTPAGNEIYAYLQPKVYGVAKFQGNRLQTVYAQIAQVANPGQIYVPAFYNPL